MTLSCSVMAMIGGLYDPYSKMVNLSARMWTKSMLLFAGVRLKVYGIEKVKKGQPYIFMSNHQSNFDVFSIFSIFNRTVRFIAKKELFNIPIFGWALYLSGTVRVDRSNRKKAIESIRTAFEKYKERVSLIIFPEGTRSPDGNIQDFKMGGFVMSIDTGLPIVPISVTGTRSILPKNSYKLKPGIVKIYISDPVDPAKYNYDSRKQYAEDVKKVIIEGLNQEKMK